MKFKNIVENLLIEASKTDTLVKKLGVNEYNAEALAKIAGPLSIFFAYKILEKYDIDRTNIRPLLRVNKQGEVYFKNRDENNIFEDFEFIYFKFDNFINYSSAELRSKIAKNKINQYSSYDTSKEQISQQSDSANTAISSSLSEKYDSITQNQINLLNTFDEYESYLFFNTSSIDDKIQDGVSYDRDNYDSLLNQLPEYLKNDPQSEDYIKFTSMVGHFFDNILVYIKKFPRSYPINYHDNNVYPKNYIEELLNNFNWDVTNFKFNKRQTTLWK